MRRILTVLLLAFAAVCASAQTPNPYVTLSGAIKGPNGLPVPNQTISFTPTQTFYVAGLGSSSCNGYNFSINGISLTCGNNVDFNNITPTAPVNGINIFFQATTTGLLNSISGALIGDGNAAHCLVGTGVFIACPGGGGGGTPGGSSGQLQYNAAGTFAGFGSYNSGTDTFSLNNLVANSISVTSPYVLQSSFPAGAPTCPSGTVAGKTCIALLTSGVLAAADNGSSTFLPYVEAATAFASSQPATCTDSSGHLTTTGCANPLPTGNQACTLFNSGGGTIYSTDCPVYESKFAAGADPIARIQGLINGMTANTSIVIDARTETGTWLGGPFEPLYGSGMSARKTGILLLPCNSVTLMNRSLVVVSGWSIIPCARQYAGTSGTTLSANLGTFPAMYNTGTVLNSGVVGGGQFTVTSVANASAGTSAYTGTFTNGGSNAFAGTTAYITGFANALNNGLYTITASTTTLLTVSNPNGVSQSTITGQAELSYIFKVTGIGTAWTANMKGSYFGVCTSDSPATVSGTACTGTPGNNAQGLIVSVNVGAQTMMVITRNTGAGVANTVGSFPSGVGYVITTPVVEMGDSAGVNEGGSNPFNYDMAIGTADVTGTIDTNGVIGANAIANRSASNLATVGKWVLGIHDAPALLIEGNQPQNSGPYGPFWVVRDNSGECLTSAMGAMIRSNSTEFGVMHDSSIALGNCVASHGSLTKTGVNEGIVNDSPSDFRGLHIGIGTDAGPLVAGTHYFAIAIGNAINQGSGCIPVCYAAPGNATGSIVTDVNLFNSGDVGIFIGTNVVASTPPTNIQVYGVNSALNPSLLNTLLVSPTCTLTYGAFSKGNAEPSLNYYTLNNLIGTVYDYDGSSTIAGCGGHQSGGAALNGKYLGWMVTNTTTIAAGVPVKADTANTGAVVTTTTGDTGAGLAIGVTEIAAASTALVPIVSSGSIPMTLGTGTCAIGQFVIVDTTTNGRIKCTSSYTAGTVIGVALEADVSVGTQFHVAVGLR